MAATLLTGDISRLRESDLAPGEDWRSAAACRDADPDLFFPVSASGNSVEQIERAKAVCAACLVRQPCLAFALRTGQSHGIWGGLSEEERSGELAAERARARGDVAAGPRLPAPPVSRP
jgi:WhiB family transcriptional regulator, redox-sensing transcriptional regulator